jgi:hypothetical protein
MSTKIYRQDDLPPIRRWILGRPLGSCIQRIREASSRSVELEVHLARMEVPRMGCRRPGPAGVTSGGYSHPYTLTSKERR